MHHYIICITLTFSEIFIANNYVLYAIFLTTKPRFNAKRAYCAIARLGVIAFGKTYISATVYDKIRKTEMWYISVHIVLPNEIYCMYIGTAVDSINGKEYTTVHVCGMYKNFKLCMCIVVALGGVKYNYADIKGGGATKF